MTSRRVTLLAGLMATCLVAASPQACAVSPTVALFSAFSLLGTWSPGCERPPSLTNPRVAWHIDRDSVVHTVSFDGRSFAIVDRVGAASLVDADTLTFTVIRAGGLYATVTIRTENGLLRVVRSVRQDGQVIVDQGREVPTGREIPADEPCSPAMS